MTRRASLAIEVQDSAFSHRTGRGGPELQYPGRLRRTEFHAEGIGGNFSGTITKWDDPEIAKANAGVKLPKADIVVVHRSDGSGTTFIWTDFLAKISEEWKKKVGNAALP